MPVAIIELIVIIILIVAASFIQTEINISGFFLNSSAFLITFGGTFAATLLHFSSREILISVKYLKQVFWIDQVYPENMANIVVELSNLFRKKGREGLKIVKKDITHPVLITGLDLLSIDIEEDEFISLLQTNIKSYYDRLKKHERIFGEMGGYAPMFGLLGTLVGLIQLLRQLADPKTIAPNMAIALVTTLYGLILAGLVFLPISGKIRTKCDTELTNVRIIFDGFVMIRQGFGPFAIEQKLRAYIS